MIKHLNPNHTQFRGNHPVLKKTVKSVKTVSHYLIPKHSKVSEKDKRVLLDSYQITVKELPKILRKDPAIAHLDVEVGDVIRIERKSDTAGKATGYRTVING